MSSLLILSSGFLHECFSILLLIPTHSPTQVFGHGGIHHTSIHLYVYDSFDRGLTHDQVHSALQVLRHGWIMHLHNGLVSSHHVPCIALKLTL